MNTIAYRIQEVAVVLALAALAYLLSGCVSLEQAWNEYVAKPSLPSGVVVTSFASMKQKDIKLSSVHCLDNGGVAVASYHNETRKNSWICIVGADGKLGNVHTVNGAETLGTGDRVGDWIYIPAEYRNGKVIRLNAKDWSVQTMDYSQPEQYGSRQVANLCVYNRSGQSGYLWNMQKGNTVGVNFPNLNGIVSGMVGDGRDDWICSADGVGIQSSKGWAIACSCPEVSSVNGVTLAFLRNGDVHQIKDGKLGKRVAKTGCKPRRARLLGNLCYWITANEDQLWVTNGEDSKMLYNFGGEKKNADTLGSLFSTSVASDGKGLVVGRTIGNAGGWELWKVAIK